MSPASGLFQATVISTITVYGTVLIFEDIVKVRPVNLFAVLRRVPGTKEVPFEHSSSSRLANGGI